ncbi:MAG: dephospho-CoA kinase [Tenericutes bacterium HGW-Tenericutes-3]|nr:MAG: dephospho-CoA kinase [Tenericutes bacterium HGW-Tenericutes-3]
MSVQNVKNNPIIIGLTGGIASGKTTASAYFNQLNIPVIDSDLIVKDLWENNQEMITKVESFFGLKIRTFEDRKNLGHLIFHNQEKREVLNQIVHPYVFEKIEELKSKYKNHHMVVIDMPLLIETGYQDLCDYILVVYVNFETQIKRLVQRDQLSREEAITRIHSQLLLEEKIKHADVILDNNHEKEELYKQIDGFLRGIQ